MVIEEIKPTNYIGYHMGDVDDFYDNSSESDELNEIIKTAKHLEIDTDNEPENYEAYTYENIYDYETNELTTIILGYGSKSDMWNFERDLHNKHKVDKEKKYFNKSKSAGAHKTIPVEDLEDLKNRILLGEFTKADEENIIDLHKELITGRLQNRTSEDDKFIREVRDDIKGARNTKLCEPIRVFINKDGTRKLFDGNTTLISAFGARKKVSTMKVDEIPYEIRKLFTDAEFNELGVLLNEKPPTRKRPCTKYDVAQVIYNRWANNSTPIKDKQNKKFIEKTGHNTSTIYEIVRPWIKKGHTSGTYINYKIPMYKKIKDGVVKKYTDSKTHVLSMSSGSFKDDKLNEWISENRNYGKCKPKKKYLYIVIHHPHEVAQDKWDDGIMSEKKKQIKFLCGLTGVVFRDFKYMDTI